MYVHLLACYFKKKLTVYVVYFVFLPSFIYSVILFAVSSILISPYLRCLWIFLPFFVLPYFVCCPLQRLRVFSLLLLTIIFVNKFTWSTDLSTAITPTSALILSSLLITPSDVCCSSWSPFAPSIISLASTRWLVYLESRTSGPPKDTVWNFWK